MVIMEVILSVLYCHHLKTPHKNEKCNLSYSQLLLKFLQLLPNLKLCEYFAQFGLVVKMNLSNLDVSYLKQHREYYKEKVKKSLTISTQNKAPIFPAQNHALSFSSHQLSLHGNIILCIFTPL